MKRDDVIATLRAHEAELKEIGIVRPAVFGSVARGETGNDVDLLAAFDEARRLSLLDLIRIERQLEELLGTDVDLVEEGTLKDGIRERVDQEAVCAFRARGARDLFPTLFRRIPTLHLLTAVEELPFRHEMVLYGLHALPIGWREERPR
jgi:uncharacterized protein